MRQTMHYDPVEGRVRPFHEDERKYTFRYFCGDEPVYSEQSIPKSDPRYVCPCGARMVVETDEVGPYLAFGESTRHHFAARQR
jgi:hypothetical protein